MGEHKLPSGVRALLPRPSTEMQINIQCGHDGQRAFMVFSQKIAKLVFDDAQLTEHIKMLQAVQENLRSTIAARAEAAAANEETTP